MIYDGIDGMVGVGIRTSFLWLVGLNPNPRCFSHVHEEPPRRNHQFQSITYAAEMK
jgi:hypothetical protein